MSIVVCTDVSGKEPHRQVGIATMVISGSLGGGMVSGLAWNSRDVGSITDLRAIFPIFVTHI